jgi:hypothetical protein
MLNGFFIALALFFYRRVKVASFGCLIMKWSLMKKGLAYSGYYSLSLYDMISFVILIISIIFVPFIVIE